jgi:hypothetical protein
MSSSDALLQRWYGNAGISASVPAAHPRAAAIA